MQVANINDQIVRGVREVSLKDSWTGDLFEDAIATASIALYESDIVPATDGTAYSGGPQHIDTDDLRRARSIGIFIPAPDRIVLDGSDLGANKIDPCAVIPDSGCVSLVSSGKIDVGLDEIKRDAFGYTQVCMFRKIQRLPGSVSPTSFGTHYEFSIIHPKKSRGIWGCKFFFTVGKNKTLSSCINRRSVSKKATKNISDLFVKTVHWSDDKRHQWCITANDDMSKVTIGAYAENVKSLLYARQLPVTASGRKRPILHIVHAHKRRMKEGIEVDIRDFLRGTREIIMNDTKYSVSAPQKFIEEYLKAA